MALESTQALTIADDGLEAFYAEKLWRLIPGVYRDEDAATKTPGALRAFVDVLASQAAAERRSIDRLWADAHITDCDDWVIPYIADLLGTRLVSKENTTGRRTDVANTIAYRRRAGTLQILSKLADDIAGWDGVASEAFKRLYRSWHSLDCAAPVGRVSGTPQGGYANIKGTRLSEVVDTAWDEVAHLPDFRRHRGLSGRYNIPKINLHLFRQFAFLVRNSAPHVFDNQHYTLDPSGRDVPLFKPGEPFVGECRQGLEWQVRGPILCGLLNDARYRPGADAAAASIGASLLVVEDELFLTAAALVARAEHLADVVELTVAEGRELLQRSMIDSSPKMKLIPDALALGIGSDTLLRSEIAGGDLSAWETIDATPWPWIRAVVDPERGRVYLPTPPVDDDILLSLRCHYGQFAAVGAGTHDRQALLAQDTPTPLPDPPPAAGDPASISNFELPGTDVAPPGTGVFQINDSRTYQHSQVAGLTTTGDLSVQAANGERPYVVLNLESGTERWVIDATDDGHNLIIDGLWLGLFPEGHGPVLDPAPAVATQLVLLGNFETVVLRNVTLDPGGVRARIAANQTEVIPSVTLLLEGAIDRLVIDHCITGPLDENTEDGDRCSTGQICILDSIIHGGSSAAAIQTRYAALEIERSTIFGDVFGASFQIDDSIVQGTLSAQDPQGSCVRYSAAVVTDTIGIPNAYRCVAYSDAMPNHLFVSRRFGDPGFAQLSPNVPNSVYRGAENTAEMGVFNSTIDAIKRDDLTRKLAEFTGINVIPQLIFET